MCLWNKCLSSTEINTLFTEKVSTGLFVKSESTWSEAQAIYQKVNGVWSEITSTDLKSIFENGSKLIQGN